MKSTSKSRISHLIYHNIQRHNFMNESSSKGISASWNRNFFRNRSASALHWSLSARMPFSLYSTANLYSARASCPSPSLRACDTATNCFRNSLYYMSLLSLFSRWSNLHCRSFITSFIQQACDVVQRVTGLQAVTENSLAERKSFWC